MNREQIINYIIKSVKDSQSKTGNPKEACNEIVNKVYGSIKPHASRAAKSARRVSVISGDYFGEQFIFFLELLDQSGLDVVERKS